MPFIGDLGVLFKLISLILYFLGVEPPIAANDRTISDAVSALNKSIDDLEKQVISAREVIADIECEKFKVCSEIEAKVGELKKELDGGDINSIQLRFPEIISEIVKLVTDLEKLLMEEGE